MVFQIVSGAILTAFYTPDFSAIRGNLNQEAMFGKSSIPLFVILIIATFAYFLSQKTFKTAKS